MASISLFALLAMFSAPHDLISNAAATLTTLAFMPQAVKSWATRDLSGVSLSMYSLFSLGVALWLIYGVMLGAWPVITANVITLALAGVALSIKVMYRCRWSAVSGNVHMTGLSRFSSYACGVEEAQVRS